MSYHLQSEFPPAVRNIRGQLFQEVTSLLLTSHLVSRSLLALRPECTFSRELTAILDRVVAISDAGEKHLYQPLMDAGATLPVTADASACALVAELFTRLPETRATREFAAEIVFNLRFLAQHIEFKSRLAAEKALLAGEHGLVLALATWSAEWYAGSRLFQTAQWQTFPPAPDAEQEEFALYQFDEVA